MSLPLTLHGRRLRPSPPGAVDAGPAHRPRGWLRLFAAPIVVLGGIGGGLVLVPLAAAGPATLYVSSSGNDGGTCTDQANPCASIQYAVQQTSPGDTIDVSGTIVGAAKI